MGEGINRMIKSSKRLLLPDISGQNNHIPIAVNWNKRVSGCKFVKFFLPGDKTMVVDRNHLQSIIFMISKKEEQMRMMKRRIVTVKEVTYPISITAKQDIKKGETMKAYTTFRIPVYDQDRVIQDEELVKKG